MDKAMLKIAMIRQYNKIAFTHNYIFGFVRNGLVYACMVENAIDLIETLTYIEKRSAGFNLRYRPNKAQQEIILANATETKILGSFDSFEIEKANHKGNRGNCFEDLCTIAWNGEQTAVNLDFTKGGDIIINGIHYQAKFGCSSKGITTAATFTEEKILASLSRKVEG